MMKEKIKVIKSIMKKTIIIVLFLANLGLFTSKKCLIAYNDGQNYPEARNYQSIGAYKSVSSYDKKANNHFVKYKFFAIYNELDIYTIFDKYVNLAPFVQERLTSPAILSKNEYIIEEKYSVGYSTTLSVSNNVKISLEKLIETSISKSFSETKMIEKSSNIKYHIPTIPHQKQFLGVIIDARIQKFSISHIRQYPFVFITMWEEVGYIATPWSTGDYWWAIQPIFVEKQQYFDFKDPGAISYLKENL